MLYDIAEILREIRHRCIEDGVDFGEALGLSWHWWNQDFIDSIMENQENE